MQAQSYYMQVYTLSAMILPTISNFTNSDSDSIEDEIITEGPSFPSNCYKQVRRVCRVRWWSSRKVTGGHLEARLCSRR